MGVIDYFKSVPTMSADEVRNFLNSHRPEEYNLVDVRQPKEYERSHLPGAVLVPLKELGGRLDGLDPDKPTIAY